MSLSKPITEFLPSDSCEDYATDDMSIFIPYARISVTREQVATAFAMNQVAYVKRVDLNRCENERGTYYQMFVHIDRWLDNPAANNIRQKIASGQQARMVYDDPQYWNMMMNRSTLKDTFRETKDEITLLREIVRENRRVIKVLFESAKVYPDGGHAFEVELTRLEMNRMIRKADDLPKSKNLTVQVARDASQEDTQSYDQLNVRPPTPEPAYYNPRSPRCDVQSRPQSPLSGQNHRQVASDMLCDNA